MLAAHSHFRFQLRFLSFLYRYSCLAFSFLTDCNPQLFDGAPGQNLYGSDLQQDFLNLGYDLFLDRSKLPESHLIASDILDKQSAVFSQLSGKIDIVYISLFLHVFTWERQVTVAKHVVDDLLAAKPGSLIVCRVIACRNQDVLTATQGRMPYYFHDLDSWKRLWDQVQQQLGLVLSVDTWEQPDEMATKHPLPGIYILGSAIRRL